MIGRDDPFDDPSIVAAFVEENYDDFEQDMARRGISRDYYCDEEYDWARNREEDFYEFADKYFQDIEEEGTPAAEEFPNEE